MHLRLISHLLLHGAVMIALAWKNEPLRKSAGSGYAEKTKAVKMETHNYAPIRNHSQYIFGDCIDDGTKSFRKVVHGYIPMVNMLKKKVITSIFFNRRKVPGCCKLTAVSWAKFFFHYSRIVLNTCFYAVIFNHHSDLNSSVVMDIVFEKNFERPISFFVEAWAVFY